MAAAICDSKLADAELKESHTKEHPDAPGVEAPQGMTSSGGFVFKQHFYWSVFHGFYTVYFIMINLYEWNFILLIIIIYMHVQYT